MGPILGALASVGKEFLAEKAAGLLNGKDKAEEETTNTNVEAFEPSSSEDNNDNNTIKDESPSAKDDDINVDNLSIPDSELEAVVQDTNNDNKEISDSELATLLPDLDVTPEATTVNDKFSADNVIIPGEQEVAQEAEQASFGVADTNGSGGISTAPTVIPQSTPQYLESAELPIAEGALPSIANESMNAANNTVSSLNGTNANVDSNELVEAIENKDPVAVENAIESDPVEAESILKDDTSLNNEATQAIDGGNDAEVSNEVIKEALKQDPEELIGTRPNFHDNDPAIERMQARIDRLNNKYERDEDFLGPDEYIDENGNIQVDPNWKPEDADEDFAGPDELPAVIEQARDEYFVDPDKQLAIYNGDVPEEIYLDPIYDTSDYNFDWDYDIETLGVANPEEIPNAPVENKEQAKAKQRLMHWFKSHGYDLGQPGSVSPMTSDNHNERLSMAGRSAGTLSMPSSGGGSVSSASMSDSSHKDSGTTPTSVKTGGGTAPITSENTGTVSVKPSTTHFSNGSMSSGSFGLMSKHRPGDIKVEKMELASGETYSDPSDNIINQMMKDGELKDVLNTDNEIENFKKMLLDELSKYKKERSKKWNG